MGICVLAAASFVTYQQWQYQHPASTPLAWFQSSPEPAAEPEAHLIQGRSFSSDTLRGMYEKIKNVYVMNSGECFHLWQCPSASLISYEDFVRQLKLGYCFTELSTTGGSHTVVLEHKGMNKTRKKCSSVTTASSCR
ncbi:MAG TPA: hypothetical protein DCZ95_04765 [Verrucomicrobia bacterium]|nr:hypothetical protein [Verrucomicrobiota bacterium]